MPAVRDRRRWQLPRAAQVVLVVLLALVAFDLAGWAVLRTSVPTAGRAGALPDTSRAMPAPVPPPAPSSPPEPLVLALIGDGVRDPTDAAPPDWTALTAQALQASGRQVAPVVAAADGAGYVARGASGEVFSELVVRTVTPTTGAVVLLGSRNDLPRAGEVGNAARVTFAAVRGVAPDAALVVVGPLPVRGDAPARLGQVRDALRDAAAASGATFVDPLAEGWSFPPGTATVSRSRGLQLAPAGQATVAQRLVPHLLPLVPVTAPAP